MGIVGGVLSSCLPACMACQDKKSAIYALLKGFMGIVSLFSLAVAGIFFWGMKLAFANDLWNRVVVSPSAAGVPCDPALYRYCRVRSAHWAGRT